MPAQVQSKLDYYRSIVSSHYKHVPEKLKLWGERLSKCDPWTQLYALDGIIQKIDPEFHSTLPSLDLKVDIVKFVCDPFYLGMEKEIYPKVLPHLEEINSGKYVEAVLTGGIGSAKTTIGLITNAYQLYMLSLMPSPHELFGLDPSSEIEIIFQNITKTLAQTVDYARFKEMIDRSPYFRERFPYNKNLKTELHFPKRIIVKPVSGSNLATIGQNVIGGLIDELNYMSVIEASKRSVDAGTYNQAVEVYNSIARRRKSRYLKQGKLPGILCLVSSKKYPGQFTDEKIEEAKSDPTIYIYDKRVWEIKPEGSFSKEMFRVFIGNEFLKPRILEGNAKSPTNKAGDVIEVPMDFLTDFNKDIVNALREIGGVSHLSKAPFFTDPDALHDMWIPGNNTIFSRESCDFDKTGLDIIVKQIKNPELVRFAHVDLALTGDSAGIVIGHCTGFKPVDRGGVAEMLPKIRIDGVLEVTPPANGEILFWKIRSIFYTLRQLGMNLKYISLDSFQSADTIQLLRQKGMRAGTQSMDKEIMPYDFLKSAIYDRRLECPDHAKLLKEMTNLQLDMKKGKVDHLPQGSKDCADALAGVVYGLTTRREIWTYYEVPLAVSIVDAIKKGEAKSAGSTAVGVTEDN